MVRTAVVGSLFLLSVPCVAEVAPPWEYDWPADMAWGWQSTNGARYYVMPAEIDRDTGASGAVNVWVHGLHARDATVKYRKSLTYAHLSCRGSYQVNAFSTLMPDGSAGENWDGFGQFKQIRPDSLFASLEKSLCSK